MHHVVRIWFNLARNSRTFQKYRLHSNAYTGTTAAKTPLVVDSSRSGELESPSKNPFYNLLSNIQGRGIAFDLEKHWCIGKQANARLLDCCFIHTLAFFFFACFLAFLLNFFGLSLIARLSISCKTIQRDEKWQLRNGSKASATTNVKVNCARF